MPTDRKGNDKDDVVVHFHIFGSIGDLHKGASNDMVIFGPHVIDIFCHVKVAMAYLGWKDHKSSQRQSHFQLA
jgi:hypothetical protein